MQESEQREFQQGGRDDDLLRFDPTDLAIMRTNSGVEIPASDQCRFVSGTRHPNREALNLLTQEPTSGTLTLPSTIPLVNVDRSDPLSRGALYGVDLVFPSELRAMHTMVFGPTGTGKNTTVLDAMRYSAVKDPHQIAVSFSLKASDYGPMERLCKASNKKLVVVNLDDPCRSAGWNPLQDVELDVAIDVIRRFADTVKNPFSNDSEFWNQWIKTALAGAWQAGYRSFPAMFQLFSLNLDVLIRTLDSHENPGSRQLAAFLKGRSQNAESVLASIIGALACFIGDNVTRVMSQDELCLRKLFREPLYLHVEIAESKLETLLVLYQMFARSVTDALIDVAEDNPRTALPATLFYDDAPSLGAILSPARLMTMRSRGIGTVSGVQSLSSLEVVYGAAASRALIDNIHTRIVLPGGVASDAEYFSLSTGQQMVGLPCFENQNATYVSRPLISGANIRSPDYRHPVLGRPATIFAGAETFQVYLQRSYEHPQMAGLFRQSSLTSGRLKLRRTRLSRPEPIVAALTDVVGSQHPSLSDTTGWSEQRVRQQLEEVRETLDFRNTTGSALKWWLAFEEENASRLSQVLRLAEELACRKASITEFFLAFVYSNTDSIRANLAYLDYTRLKKEEEKKKREARSEDGVDEAWPFD